MAKKKTERGLRYNQSKLNWSLVDFPSFDDMVRVLEFGSRKYTADNWKHGLLVREICESLLRHTFAFLAGEDDDPESGLPHIGHLQCNAMFLAYTMKYRKDLDNRLKDPNRKFQNELSSKKCIKSKRKS